ncbi:MAG: hypothetical protein VX436_02905 [Planctomycetota bacterium]|nr:hypothetical protein [Planctomycetota bacterium]
MIRVIAILSTLLLVATGFGCAIIAFGGAAKQAIEDQMLIEKPAEYSLEGMSVAVVINTDLVIHYEHPGIASLIAEAVSGRLAKHVKNISVVHPGMIAKWQFETPQWTAMPTSEIASELQVDRVVYIDLLEYRLTPPGNQWLWEGSCSAVIGIIEADSYEQDGFSDSYEINAIFPRRPSILSRDEGKEADIERGLLNEFIKQTSWLFFFHEEPKHPDRYRPELN